ncbi:MAG: DUF554 domain-containing protein, partial [Actinobacteria bacterium]
MPRRLRVRSRQEHRRSRATSGFPATRTTSPSGTRSSSTKGSEALPSNLPGIGVAANVATVLIGTAIGLAFGGMISDRLRKIAFSAIGLSTFLIGAAMSIGGLDALGKTKIGNYAPLVLVGSLVIGSLIGEAIRVEHWLEQFGHWMQSIAHRIPFLSPVPKDESAEEEGHTLVEGIVTAPLLFCVGAMTVLGSIPDGLGNPALSLIPI